jgi:DNA-binding LytR/AlgR family response regulator
MSPRPTALIADDEPLLREALTRHLALAWPELEVVAQVRNGREAVKQFEALQPDICFLDVHLPGLSGIDAARQIGSRAHLVFITAYDHYAVEAFAQGALDYLVKPVEATRLADTVDRLKNRLRAAQPAPDFGALLEKLAAEVARIQSGDAPSLLRWVRAQVGQSVRLIAVESIDYLRSDEKYTRVAWRDDSGQPADALVRLALKDLVTQLDPAQFAQVHRSVVVNLRVVSHVTRAEGETADLHLKGRKEVLPVSRSYLHLFHQM